MPSAIEAIRQAHADGIRPDVLLTVSQWADAHRKLPKKSSAEPGPWRTSRTPYLRELMDCFSSASPVEEVVLMKAAQVGGSEAILNALGYAIDHCPGPVILVQPTVELAKRFSRQRLDPLLTDTPRLAERVPPARSRDSGNTVLSKEFPGGQLIITGANSAVGLRSMPAQYALLDEVDGYPVDVDEEGSPIGLVEVRQRTFARKKRMKVSTPTIAGRSAIEHAYDVSDQRRFYVPCPDCGEMQPLVFAQLRWTQLGLPPEQAVYECRACLFHIRNHQKAQMLAAGEWRAEVPERAGGKVRGYHLNALYAPVGWMSWGDIAKAFEDTHRDPEKFRVFINTVLGEVWTSRGDAPEWETVQRRRENYRIGTVPMGALVLTAGVDVQKDRLVYEVIGWGRGKRSWSIDYGEIPGDTADIDEGPWPQVDALLNRRYAHESGLELSILMMAVDAGYNQNTVVSWTRKYPLSRVVAIKGQDHGSALVMSPTAVEVTVRGKKLKNGGRLWPVCGAIGKNELFGWLRLERREDGSEPDGFCHFPEYGEEYFKQLTAEQLVSHKSRRGYIRMQWEQIPGRQNHVLDARIYGRCAAALAGLDRFHESDWRKLEDRRGIARREEAPPVERPGTTPTAAASAAPKKLKPGWIQQRPGGWLRGGR